MHIQSRFSDYYDYVEYLYTPEGGDPENTYDRRIKTTSVSVKGSLPLFPQPIRDCFPPTREQQKVKSWGNDWTYFPWRFKWCFVAGKLYLTVGEANYKVDSRGEGSEKNPSKFRLLTANHPSMKYLRDGTSFRSKRVDHFFLRPSLNETGDLVAKEVGPVFMIDLTRPLEYFHGSGKHLYEVILMDQVPNLGQLGFASVTPAEKMYQDISMYIGKLKNSPDSQPPAFVSDKDRLVQKGFDLKTSFRGKQLK
jgi:hypothetical protein